MTKVSRSPKEKTLFWQELQLQYYTGHFCDLQIHFQGTSDVILCHKMVLASVSSLVKEAVIVSDDDPGVTTNILLPDADYSSTKGVVDFLYSFLAAGEIPAGYVINKIALDTLAIDLTTLGEKQPDIVPNKANPLDKPACRGVKRKRVDRKLSSDFWELDDIKITTSLFQPHVVLEKLPKYRRKVNKSCKPTKTEHVLSRPVMKKTNEELERLRNPQLCSAIRQKIVDCQGELDIDIHKEPMRYLRQYFDWSPFKVEDFAILGIKKCGDSFEGLTLTHKLKSGEDPFLQFKTTGEAFKSVLGFSTRDVFCQSIIPRKLNVTQFNRRGKIKPKYVKDLAQFNDEQLKVVLEDPEIVDITRRKPAKTLELHPGHIRINLNSDLLIGDLEHILMLFVLETGQIKARMCRILDDDMVKTVSQLHMCIFHVWSDPNKKEVPHELSRRREKRKNEGGRRYRDKWSPVQYLIIDSPDLKALYYKLLDPCMKVDVAQAYLKGELDRDQVLNKSVVCPKCGLNFPLTSVSEEGKYSLHQRRHYFEDYKCDCGIDFAHYNEKKWHVMLHHDTGRNYKKCDFCPYVSNLSKLKIHVKVYHSKDSKVDLTMPIKNEHYSVFRCEECNKTFHSQSNAQVHFNRKHKTVTCSICGEDFKGDTSLKQHVKTNHPSRIDEFYGINGHTIPSNLCDLCGKDFSGKNNLALHHQYIHAEVNCEICKVSVTGTTKLRNHMAKHHPESVTGHVCSYCGKKFLDKNAMNRHMRQVHNEGNCKTHQCDMCPRSFVWKSGLKAHRITMHLKTPVYKCRVCEEGFYDTSARYNHEKKLHGFQHKQNRKRNILDKQ